MAKVMVALYHKPEEYHVVVSIYDSEGRLAKEMEFNGIKQVILYADEVRVSAQLANQPTVLIAELDKPVYSVKEGTLLVIGERK